MNTKITFFWTHIEDGTLQKTIFQCIVNKFFEDTSEVLDWHDEFIDEIYNKFDFHIVLDHVILDFVKIDEAVTDFEIIHFEEEIESELALAQKKIIELELESKLTISKLELELAKSQLLVATLTKKSSIFEMSILRADIARLKSENAVLVDKKEKENKQKKKEYESVWIKPNGDYFKVPFADHEKFARKWLDKNMTEEEQEAANIKFNIKERAYCFEILQEFGWCRILGWSDPPSIVLPKVLTPKLVKTVKTYCQNNGIKYPIKLIN